MEGPNMSNFIDGGATTKTKMLNQMVRGDTIFLGEGKSVLIEEYLSMDDI